MRKICYITGTRADFGLMKNALRCIHEHPEFKLSLLVTGMHLLSAYGETWKEIADQGLSIQAKIEVKLTGGSGDEMAIALGEQIIGFTTALQQQRPDLLMLLGDRGEMLAGAIAALHLNIPIVHIHGGELSGTVDESIRHAISKLAHYHFTATEKSRERLIRMGEKPENIIVTGAPGLDEIYHTDLIERESLFNRLNLDHQQPLLLALFHSVVQQAGEAEMQTRELLEAVIESAMQSLIIMPNSDAGSAAITEVIESYKTNNNIHVAVHVPRHEYLSLLASAELLVGNSSSGIIEAASLGTPVVNIGDRQMCRERNRNVIDVVPEKNEISNAISKARQMKGQSWNNVYGNGEATANILQALLTLSLSPEILEKVNAY